MDQSTGHLQDTAFFKGNLALVAILRISERSIIPIRLILRHNHFSHECHGG